ncbi:hypothetical protein COL23_13420 [Priestia aryabhattai]|uniref:hypothetical protein n=1 Tax=Priestia aryabhattai TaxID=412384 RepID=UPI000BF2A6D2|nr:hypothetical protein [Priestia aryabhattai]PFW75832.1 hypothetical protein COL23_13420 [Priestia aryabhattai]
MFKRSEPYAHSYSKEYQDFVSKVYDKYPDDPNAAVKYIKQNASRHTYITYLLQLTQNELISESANPRWEQPTYQFSAGELEFMLRGFFDAVDHLENDLPAGVFDYISNRSEDFLLKCLKTTYEKNDNSQSRDL